LRPAFSLCTFAGKTIEKVGEPMFAVGMKKCEMLPHRITCPPDAVVVFQSELDYLSRYILDYPYIETGGQLFGYWTSTGVPVVLYVLGPGDNANHQHAFFNQDLEYLERVGGLLTSEFGLQHIGEWHSHHQLGLAHPSFHDAHNIQESMLHYGLPRFLLCIGICTPTTTTVNAFNFVDESTVYREAQWDVMAMDSPFRKVVDQRLDGLLRHPITSTPALEKMKYRRQRGVKYPPGYWMNEKGNNKELKQMLDFIQSRSEGLLCSVTLDDQGMVHILSKDEEQNVWQDVLFSMEFPTRFPIITNEILGVCATGEGWNLEGVTIAQAFVEYYYLHEI
jgi:hypothetical protein